MVFLGREICEQRNYSDEIAYEIDKEVRALVDEAYDKAKEILTIYKDKLIEISELLIERRPWTRSTSRLSSRVCRGPS